MKSMRKHSFSFCCVPCCFPMTQRRLHTNIPPSIIMKHLLILMRIQFIDFLCLTRTGICLVGQYSIIV